MLHRIGTWFTAKGILGRDIKASTNNLSQLIQTLLKQKMNHLRLTGGSPLSSLAKERLHILLKLQILNPLENT